MLYEWEADSEGSRGNAGRAMTRVFDHACEQLDS